jgi:hypothetical protein
MQQHMEQQQQLEDAAGQTLHAVHATAAMEAAAAVQAVRGGMFGTGSSVAGTSAERSLLQDPPAATTSTSAAMGLMQEPVAAASSIGNTSQVLSSLRHTGSTASMRRQPDPECVVCMDARACVRTQPCGHQVLCWGCAEQVASSKGKGECPMCRAVVEQYVVVPRAVRG